MPFPRLGITEIDNQHKDMMFFLAQIANDKAHVTKIINEFLAYTTEHFKLEEDMMRKTHYPQIDSHIREHERIQDYLLKELIYSAYNISDEKIEKVRMAVLGHIMSYDSQLAEWYKSNEL